MRERYFLINPIFLLLGVTRHSPLFTKINVLLHAYNKLFASIDSRPTAYFSTRTSEPDWIRDCDERALMDSDSTQKWKTVVKERKD